MRSGLGPRLCSSPRSAAIVRAVLVALAATAGFTASAQAATYTVGTTEDRLGVCAPASGTCSLRQLIQYENNLASPPSPSDVIVVPSGKYVLTNGEVGIVQSLAIIGAGAGTTQMDEPEGTEARVFDVKVPGTSKVEVFISGLEISGGTANTGNGSFGGDVRNAGSLLLSEDWITNGTAESGGGLSNEAGTLVVERSLVSGNHASLGGGDSGGIQNFGSPGPPDKPGALAVLDSTIAHNDARLGGGIFSWGDANNTITIEGSTIAFNSTQAEPSGAAREPGAGLALGETDGGTAQVVGSIIADNTETPAGAGALNSNCHATAPARIVSLGYNLENEVDCGFTSTGDLQNTFPEFTFGEELHNNGGNTDTLAPTPTSPAVDAIPAGNPFCNGTDQRGIARPQGAGCDIGAVELVPLTIQATEGAQFSGQVATSPSCGIFPEPPPTIEWGDGSTSQGTVDESGGVNGVHTYVEEGTYTGTVTYSNDCDRGVPIKVAFVANVADAPLSATGVPVSATAGLQLSATVATFTDADPAGTALDYTANISWGDGTTSTGTIASAAGGGFAVTGSHTYAAAGAYQVTVAIKDVGGAAATATSTANVANPPSAPPTLLTSSSPTVLSTTSAAFTATVNPHGLATTVHFEYGPVLGGAKAAAITYGSVTPDQSVGPDFANHTVTATVTGLLPNVTYNVRVVATNSAGNATGPNQTLVTPADPSPPPPVLGKAVNVTPVSGVVYIELPPGATSASAASVLPFALGASAFEALTKGQAFIPLTEARQIPVGSVLETTGGVVGITTATTASRKGKLQTGDFGAGIFKLLQGRKQKGLTDLDIINNHNASQVCATVGKKGKALAAKLSSKTLGHINASGHGHFAVRGQYSAATVRGTVWSVANRCEGTLTHVTRGVVSVRDFRRRKTITLFTGESYLARAPHR
jgi:hypothetical protein